MAQTADDLVEQRVAQLEEIQRRRHELLREMYHLLKRKDDLGTMISVDEHDKAKLASFVDEWDLTKKPDFQHIAALLAPHDPQPLVPYSPTPPREVSLVEEDLHIEEQPDTTKPRTPTPPAAPAESPPLTPVPEVEEAASVRQDPVPSDDMEVDSAPRTPADPAPAEEHDQQPPPYSPVGPPSEGRRSASRVPSEPRTEIKAESRAPSLHPREPSVSVLVSEDQEQPEIKPSPREERVSVDIVMEPANDAARKSATSASRSSTAPKNNTAATTVPVDEPAVPEPSLPLTRETHPAHMEYTLSNLPQALPPSSFVFKEEPKDVTMEDTQPVKPTPSPLWKPPTYPLPPLPALPVEFHKKGKPKQSRKRDKEKGDNKNQEWQPMGMAKWAATIRANPVYKKMARASKCLSSRDWDVAMTELKLLRTIERIDHLSKTTGWSFRQPKKHRGVGGLTKTHWDYLMDEMKWMRTDFREERKWKLALAHTLARAVMDWHAAGSKAERERLGICLNWKKPRPEELDDEQVEMQLEPEDVPMDEGSKANSTPVNEENSNSDDDSDDEHEREQRARQDAADSHAAIEEALGAMESSAESQNTGSQPEQIQIQPKVEDIEDRSALHRDDTMDVDGPSGSSSPKKTPDTPAKPEEPKAKPTGLKASSNNPVLIGPVSQPETHVPRAKTKSSSYAPLREQIVYSDPDKLFLDMDDFGLSQSMSELTTDDPVLAMPPPPADISAIFPDLQPYGMLDVAPPVTEGKKKSDRRGDRDDPNKRAEDTTYQKLTPMSEFIYNRSTLMGSLRPSKHWRHGHWQDLDETTIVADSDTPSRPTDDSIACALFDGVKSHTPTIMPPQIPMNIRDIRRRTLFETVLDGRNTPNIPGYHHKARTLDLVWTPQDDAVLKQLVEKWPNNWGLIADSFNSSRLTLSSDRRSATDCFERWRARLSGAGDDDARAPPQTPTTMTTRGTKRSMSMSVGANNAGSGPGHYGNESRKRRRHTVMFDTIRKAAKKKEATAKANAANQRKPTAIHDTHGQFNKMPKLTPSELSRIKADKDQREAQAQLLRQRQNDLDARHVLQQRAAIQQNGQAAAVAQNGQLRTPNVLPTSTVPQIRNQANIAQRHVQQQMAHLANAAQTARLTPGQSVAMMNRNLLAQVQAQAQAQAQVQAQGHVGSLAAGAAPALQAHLSPPYNVARPASASPGVPQQSPPHQQAIIHNPVTSPRPPSAQAQVTAPSPTATAARAAQPVAHYYTGVTGPAAAAMNAQSFDPNHIRQLIMQQNLALQQQQQQQQQAQQAQQAQQQHQQQLQQNGSYGLS
ncbi:hypothetical protein EIP86_004189 [Pleurotus ostreatoroseus]|nr:hypothetical protein EIP86_004189 [Pleurotus ostreatoroseus]